jgi:hypothetical protein
MDTFPYLIEDPDGRPIGVVWATSLKEARAMAEIEIAASDHYHSRCRVRVLPLYNHLFEDED